MTKVERIYDISFNGVAKAVASQEEYCSDAKTKTIKADLGRHLAGDYTPSPPQPSQDEGIFSGWGSASSEDKRMPTPFDPD